MSSVRSSARMEQLGSHGRIFLKFNIGAFFEKIEFSLKSNKIKGYVETYVPL
jgi:hypothetical protein